MKRKEVCLAGIECASLEGIWYIWLAWLVPTKRRKKKKLKATEGQERVARTYFFFLN
jgi:hypothetical protein